MASPSAVSALRTAWAGSTAARAAARTLSSGGLTDRGLTRGDLDGFATGQLGGHVPIRRQEPLEVALDHLRGDQTVASDPQAGGNARAFADNGDPRLQIARLRAIGPSVVAMPEMHVGANDHVLVQDAVVDDAAGSDNAIRKQDAVAHDGALCNEDARRQDRMLDSAVDDRAV